LRRVLRATLVCTAIAAGVVAVVVAASAALVGPSVWSASREGRTALVEGAKAVVRKDADAARVEFRSARDVFVRASTRLGSRLTFPLRVVPVVSTHFGVSRALADIGVTVADAGLAVADAMEQLPDQQLSIRDGRIDLELVRVAQRALAAGVRSASAIENLIHDMPAGWVGGPLAAPRRQVLDVLPGVLDGVRKAELALRRLPSILAADGKKRYLVAFSNLSELRGSGGLFGYVTALKAERGDLDLENLSGRPTEIFPAPGDVGLDYPDWFPDDLRAQARIFQNINMTTDFPTVGRFVEQTAEKEAGELDGVIAVDPVGIAAVLSLTGPIRVPTWHQQITADNVARIAMYDVYVQIPRDRERRELFFEDLVRTTFAKLVSSTIALTPSSIGAFDAAVQGGHFRMYSQHNEDQSAFDRLGMSGAVDRARSATDVVSLVSENASGNKADWFLRRELRYRVELDPETRRASSVLDVSLRNGAPETGLPEYVIGSPLGDLRKGTNRQIVMLVRSARDELRRLQIGGESTQSSNAFEGPLHAYRSTIDLPAEGRTTVSAASDVAGALERVGDELVYRLVVMRQPVAHPDFADIEIVAPKGWTATGTSRYLGDLTRDVTLEIRLERSTRGSLVETVFARPWRFMRRTIAKVF
jgi:hypothetical protein